MKHMSKHHWEKFYIFCQAKIRESIILLNTGCTHEEIYSALYPLYLEEDASVPENRNHYRTWQRLGRKLIAIAEKRKEYIKFQRISAKKLKELQQDVEAMKRTIEVLKR